MSVNNPAQGVPNYTIIIVVTIIITTTTAIIIIIIIMPKFLGYAGAQKFFKLGCRCNPFCSGSVEPAKPSPACLPSLSGAVHIRPRRALEARGPTLSAANTALRMLCSPQTRLDRTNRAEQIG